MDDPPEKRPLRMRGNRAQLSISLPPDLIAECDEYAKHDERSRNKILELALKQFLQRQKETEN